MWGTPNGLWFATAGKPVFPLASTGGDARKFYLVGGRNPFISMRVFRVSRSKIMTGSGTLSREL
jgi:hypothetical protein